MHCANMMESARLWQELEIYNRNLEATITERTRELETATESALAASRAKRESDGGVRIAVVDSGRGIP
jgi:hypothetical protein